MATPIVTGRTPRAIAKASSRAIVTSPTHVYFGDTDGDALYAHPKSGGELTRLARRAPMPGALSIDVGEAALAWIGSPGDIILRMPVKGGTPTTIRDNGIFSDVAISGADVFFTEVQGTGGVLTRVTGATAARLGTFGGTPHGIIVDAKHVYLATSSRLAATTRTRGEITDLASGVGFASPQIDDTWLYARAVDLKSRAHIIVRVRKAGPGPLETIATNVRDAPIAVYKDTVYWVDADRNALLAYQPSAPGGAPRTVSEDAMLERVNAITIDDDGVFMATGYGDLGRIVVIAFR